MNKCKCGKRMSKYATRCKACSEAHYTKLNDEARAIVSTGVCPVCGSVIRRNLALSGWWQCSQFGADGFRADSTKPSCGWQTFTE